MTKEQLQQSWPEFSKQIQAFITHLGLNKLACDHVALRVNSSVTADKLRHYFEQQGQLISNKMINGRPILIFELNSPLQLGELSIECVELPYPGEKAYPVEGWEHIELVLPGNAQTSEQLQQQLLKLAPNLSSVLAGQTDIKVKLSAPKGEGERLTNPTIAFKHKGICIKVHAHGIKAIIASEG